MSARDYISVMVNTNKIIYIDTASLMDVEELSQFIQNGEDILRDKNRRIVVPQAVCLELVRHLGSENQKKQDKAMRALGLIKDHQDIFEVRNQGLTEDEIYSAFADAEILAELTRNKKNCGQLLITNDRALGQDAFELNNQGSCRGYRIMVCFINRFGELRKCECTYSTTGETAKVAEAIWNNEEQDTAAQHQIDKMLDTTAQNKAGKELDATARARAEKKQKIGDESKNTSAVEPKEGPSLWDVLIPTGTFFLGFLTCKYGKTAVKAAKTIIALI